MSQKLGGSRGEYALIAVQGPRSADALAPLVAADLSALKYYGCIETRVGGVAAIVARTGYTGEDGFEIFLPDDAASGVWEALSAGNGAWLAPCGERAFWPAEPGRRWPGPGFFPGFPLPP